MPIYLPQSRKVKKVLEMMKKMGPTRAKERVVNSDISMNHQFDTPIWIILRIVSLLMDVFLPKTKAKAMTNPRKEKEAIIPTILLFMSSIMMR